MQKDDEDTPGLILKPGRVQKLAKHFQPELLPMSKDAAAALTKATEVFLTEMGKKANDKACSSDSKQIEYNHVADTVKGSSALDFLAETVPQKVKGSEILARLQEKDEK